MWKKATGWLRRESKYSSIGLFFVWGILMSTLSGGMGTIWSVPILLLTHTVSGFGIYFGILKGLDNKRGTIGIVLNILATVYNLSIDMLYILF